MSNKWGKRERGENCQVVNVRKTKVRDFKFVGVVQQYIIGVRNVKIRSGNHIRHFAKLSDNYIMKER